MKPGEPLPLKDVLDPKSGPMVEMVVPHSPPPEQGAVIDGFSFATHTTGGRRRDLRFWFKIVAWIFVGWAALGLVVQAASVIYSIILT